MISSVISLNPQVLSDKLTIFFSWTGPASYAVVTPLRKAASYEQRNAVVRPLRKAASYEPRIAISGFWGNTWLNPRKGHVTTTYCHVDAVFATI